jgi:hypothetical protein
MSGMGEALIEGKSRQRAKPPYLGSKTALGLKVARFQRGKNVGDQIVQFRAIGAKRHDGILQLNGPTSAPKLPLLKLFSHTASQFWR